MDKPELQQQVLLVGAGHEAELLTLQNKLQAAMNDSALYKAYLESDDEDKDEDKKPYQCHEGIAIIEMKGPMVSRSNWMTKWFGIKSYEDLRAEVVEAISDPDVQQILIDADTPGGQVNGIGELTGLIKKARGIKPIDVYAGGGLMSAGYWVASAAGKIYASETAMVGSIGVVVTHTSYEGMLEKSGIKVTKITSGDKKQVGSSEKNLSSEDKAYLQARVNDLFGLFKRQVLTGRPNANADAFDGSEYIADKALAMGLVDMVSSFDDVLATLINQRESSASGNANMQGGIAMKKALTAEQLAAAVASGADPGGLASGDAGTVTLETPETPETPAAIADQPGAAESAPAAEGGEPAPAQPAAGTDSVATYLETQLAKSNDKIADLTVQLREANAKVAAHEETVPKLKTIVSEAINRMNVAMGLARVDLSTYEATALVTQYEAVSESFQKTFKTGGVLTVGPKASEGQAPAKITRIDSARQAAVGIK